MLGAYERWCGVDDAMMTWLMVPEVMEALHIRVDKKATEKNNLNYQVRCLDPSIQTLLCLCGLSVGLRRLASEASRDRSALALTLPSLLSSCWARSSDSPSGSWSLCWCLRSIPDLLTLDCSGSGLRRL